MEMFSAWIKDGENNRFLFFLPLHLSRLLEKKVIFLFFPPSPSLKTLNKKKKSDLSLDMHTSHSTLAITTSYSLPWTFEQVIAYE